MAVLRLVEQLAHRAGLARGPRGPAGGGLDDDPGQPGQAGRVRLGAVVGRAGRHYLRRAAGQRVPDRLRHPDPDPDLRRAHPRRRGQHRRRLPRRPGGHDHLRRAAAQPDPRGLPVLRADPADPAGQAAPVAQAGRGPGRDRGARLRGARHRPGDIGPRGRRRAAVGRLDRRRAARLGDRPGQRADRRELGIRRAGLPADHARRRSAAVADHPAAADPLSGLVRLGDPAGRGALGYPAAHDRRDTDRDDERPAAGTARAARAWRL